MTLKDYLAAQGMTAAAFAARVQTHESTMSRILAGKQRPRADLMHRIGAATGGAVTPNDFFDTPAATAPGTSCDATPAAGEAA